MAIEPSRRHELLDATGAARRRDNRKINFYYALVSAGALAFWIVGSAIEARSYNRITGASVSTWDAMFLHLVVGHDAPRRGR